MKRLSAFLLPVLMGMAGTSNVMAQRIIELTEPSVKVFLPDASKATGRAVVILPGGGYSHTAINHEGYDWAPFFNERGIACSVVDYRMPHGDRKIPLTDAGMAMKMMRDSAEVWHIDPAQVGIMGSSAGGHLASTVALNAPSAVRPDFQILFYPVISMDKAYTHMGSHDNLLGKDATPELEREYSGELNVTPETPRAIMLLSADDSAVPPHNSIAYFEALRANNVPAAMYIWPSGGHGWGSREKFKYHNEMLAELSAWLLSF